MLSVNKIKQVTRNEITVEQIFMVQLMHFS